MLADDRIVSFAHHVVIRKSLNGNILSMRVHLSRDGFVQIIVNDTAVLLMSEIGEGKSLQHIVDDFCVKYCQNPFTAKEWIVDFLKQAFDLGIIVWGTPTGNGRLTIVDSSKTVSPASADIEVTSSCNLSCAFCYAKGGESDDFFPVEHIPRVFDELANAGVMTLGLTGGEFFVHRNAMDILAYAVERFPQIGLLTNGTLISKEAVSYIARHSNQIMVGVSVDSVRSEFHDKLRGKQGAHARAIKAIRNLSEHGVNVRLSSVICEGNKWEIADLAEFAKTLGAATFCFSFVEEAGRGVEFNATKKIMPTESYGRFVVDVVKEYGDYMPFVRRRDLRENRVNCGAGTGRIVIGADGYVRPCLMLGKTKKFGNVLQQSLCDILASPAMRQMARVPEPSEKHGCPRECIHVSECFRCIARGFSRGKRRRNERSCYCAWIEKNRLQVLADEFSESFLSAMCNESCDATTASEKR